MQIAAQPLVINLYKSHKTWLHSWLYKKMGSTFDAADITQDTFIKVMQKDDLHTVQEPRAYLITVASRLIIDHVRRRNIERAYIEALTDAVSQAPSPQQIHEAIATLVEISNMLDGLSDKARRAFLMARLDGLSYAEIAVELGVSSSMVKQYIASVTMHCYKMVYE